MLVNEVQKHRARGSHEPDGDAIRAIAGSLADHRLATAVNSDLHDATMKRHATIGQNRERLHPWSGRWRISP
jgi:hypothetical protein